MISHQNQINSVQIRSSRLQYSAKAITLTSEGYHESRNKFLDVWRRDVRNDLGGQGRDNIVEGNEATHHANAVADASLYTSCARFDEAVLLEICGLTSFKFLLLVSVILHPLSL
jgi:hypothetical protein